MLFIRRSILAMLAVLMLSTTLVAQDTPLYTDRGQFAVGTQDFVIEGEMPLDITVWYPADADADASITYPYITKPDSSMGMEPFVNGNAITDGPYALDSAPYPLVILSHGYSLGRTGYAWLAEHLASYGFVVVAPQHYELVDETMSDFWRASITRPQEITIVLDYVEDQATSDGMFSGLIDTESIAVVGHSYGGYTALAMAGAQIDVDSMSALCAEAEASEDPNAWLCGMVMPYVEDMAQLAGFDAVPDGLWGSVGDERIDAIVSMAGDAYFFNEPGLAEITIPVLAMGGTADTGTPFAWGTQPTFEFVSSERKAQVAFEDGEHMIFGASCEQLPFFAEIGFDAYCSDPVWDMDEVHDLAQHFATAFLLSELKQDADATQALTSDAVNFDGIAYQAQGY